MFFRSRFALTVLIGLVLAAGVFSGFRIALHSVGEKMQTLLGPQGQVEDIRIKLTGVEILGLKIGTPRTRGDAPSDWPDIDPLRVDRIFIEPSFASLFFSGTVLRNVRIEGASLAVLRTRDGRLKILPGMLDNTRKKTSSGEKGGGGGKKPAPLTIEKIELVGSAIDFFDASIRSETHKARLERINATIGKVNFPERDGFTSVDLTGIVKGKRNDGKLTLTGSIELATLESGITAHLRGIDLFVMTPYLLKKGDKGIDGGTLDIDVKSAVRQGKLHAPGTLTIDGLRVSPSGENAFLGVSLENVASLLKDRLGKISFNFVVEGDIGESGFLSSERLVVHVDSPMASYFGIRLAVPGEKPDGMKRVERKAVKRLLKNLREKSK